MDSDSYCADGGQHSWISPNWECDCGDNMCCLECADCDAVDCYCEDA